MEAVKEYKDVLDLGKGLVSVTLREAADGFQVKDLLPILTENLAQALAAYEGSNQIGLAWKQDPEACTRLTVEFAVDVAMDIMKIPAGSDAEFKETQELLAAVSGITSSVVAHLPGGFQTSEIIPVVFENFNSIMVGVDGVGKIGAELKKDLRAFIKLVALSAIDLAFKVKKAMEAPQPA
jgi:hypothetical protein